MAAEVIEAGGRKSPTYSTSPQITLSEGMGGKQLNSVREAYLAQLSAVNMHAIHSFWLCTSGVLVGSNLFTQIYINTALIHIHTTSNANLAICLAELRFRFVNF